MTCATLRTLENYIGDVSTPDIRWTPRRKDAVAKLILDNDIDVTILKTFFNISQEELDTWVQKFRDARDEYHSNRDFLNG